MKRKMRSILVLMLAMLTLAACGKTGDNPAESQGEDSEKVSDNSGAHEHEWGEGVVKTAAGCIANGTMLYTCECESTKRESIPATGHDMQWVEAVAATDTTEGIKEHWVCNNCEKLFVDEAFCLDPWTNFTDVTYPFGNFNGTEFYIERLGDNKVAKLASNAYYPADLAITKEFSVADIPAGEYVMTFDVLLGQEVHADQWSFVVAIINDGNDGRKDILNTKPDANSLGYNMLTNANSSTWTTFEIPFTTTGEYTTLKAEVYLWPENYLNEPIYLDNFTVYKKGDDTRTNIDTLGGDFENVETYLEVEETDLIIR